MIFSVILLALTGVAAFFLYTQGFFSATISAILATVAAVLALGYYESVAPLLFNAKIYDQAASISMVLIFAIAFIVPRLIIDAWVPGNVRVPFIVDKVGAGLMGLVAALMATGVVAVAADALPFGPSVGMYSRFPLTDDKDKNYQNQNGQMQDTTNYDVFKDDKLDPSDPELSHVWTRQDDLVVGLVSKVSSETGSLSNDHPFINEHPDLLDEYYGQRLGIQVGAKHTAVNTEQSQPVSVKGIYTPPVPIPQVDGEQTTMRLSGVAPPAPTVTADGDQIVLVVRVNLSGKDLADDDNFIRFSPSAIRLTAGEPDAGVGYKDYYPVATLDTKGIAVACRPDDYLIADSGSRTVDFVFVVDRDHVMSADESKPPFHLPAGTFVDFKRYGVCDLSGQQVVFGPPPNPDKSPLDYRPSVTKATAEMQGLWTGAAATASESGGAGGAGGGSVGGGEQAGGGDQGSGAEVPAGQQALGDSGLSYIQISASNKLASPINCGTGDDNATVQLNNGVGGELAHRQWAQLTVNSTTPMKDLAEPQSDAIGQLAVDPNTVLVQVECGAPISGSASEMWSWGKRVSDFALADATGHTYPCVGVWATAQRGTQHFILVSYKNFDDKNHIIGFTTQKSRPVNVWLAFEVPSGTPIAEVRFSAKTAVDSLNFKAP